MSVDKVARAPSFNSIQTNLYSELNKNFPKDITNLKNAPNISPFYKTLDEEDFVIFKDNRNLILQSPNLAKIHLEHGAIVFCDAIFSIFLH